MVDLQKKASVNLSSSFFVCDETPRFQSAKPIGKSGPGFLESEILAS